MTNKSKTITEIKSLSLSALHARALDLQDEFLKKKIDTAVQKGSKDLHTSFKKRKELAQVKTRITQLEREAK